MSDSIATKLSSFDKQIIELKEKKKKELEKMQMKVGKEFISAFDLQDTSMNEINKLIVTLKNNYDNSLIKSNDEE